jgi:hypothetical protein
MKRCPDRTAESCGVTGSVVVITGVMATGTGCIVARCLAKGAPRSANNGGDVFGGVIVGGRAEPTV